MNFTKEDLDHFPVPAGKVVFLGSNPSCSSPYNDPFSHCKSANKMLNEWIPALGLTRDQVYFMNVANYKTAGNKPLKASQITAELPRLIKLLEGQIVVTLGKTAAAAMDKVVSYYLLSGLAKEPASFPGLPRVIELPHPSGLNRKLNDKKYVEDFLMRAKLKLGDWMK